VGSQRLTAWAMARPSGKGLKSDHDGLLPNHCIIFPFHCTKSSRHRLTFNTQLSWSESYSESDLLYDWRFTVNQFLATSPLRHTTNNFIFQSNTCSYSPYVTSSLTRGWVCRLQLLLFLASAVILRSRGTHDHILLSQIRDSPNLEGQVPVFISLRNRVDRLYPQTLAPLFVASYDSQGYGRGSRSRLHAAVHIVIYSGKTTSN
jgi:hypothetical protein